MYMLSLVKIDRFYYHISVLLIVIQIKLLKILRNPNMRVTRHSLCSESFFQMQ